MSFGYGTKEFEVTTARLGCYRPEEHIDNPKDYADNEDARNYDRRLRGPIDEERELAIDPVLGLKAYIASENLGIDTSAALVRKLFGNSIELGRRYARNGNKDDLYEALRLLGTGCHCLEDFSAHSNYTELALIELGERNIFPHVGRNCRVRLRGARAPVYPIVTGTFGGVDFLHSVTGEFDDKATQSEIQELEGTLQQAQQQGENTSIIQGLLQKLPDGIFGGKDEAGKAEELKMNATQQAMASAQVSPRQPEEWLQYITDVQKQIYPILEWHDEIMKSITETIEKIPILPEVIENVQEQVNIFVFSLLAPFVLPIISQIKTELNTGSSEIIQSSVDKQHIVFNDDDSSDPTHSMLSKDHFSNVLNEPAGKVAGQVLKWVVPQLIAAWDDENIDVGRTLNRIIRGVFHHPALREVGEDGSAGGRGLMFAVVERWWDEKSEEEKEGLRDQLSREGVEEGRNHKPGVQDHGHGSAGKLGMPNIYTANHQGAPGGQSNPHSQVIDQLGQTAGEAVGGGILGSLVGGLTSAVGRGVVAGAMGDQSEPQDVQTYNRTSYGDDGSRTQTITQLGGNRQTGNYSQAQYSTTEDRMGGRTSEYTRTEQHHEGGSRYSGQTTYEERSSYGEHTSETRRFEANISNNYGHDDEDGGYSSSRFEGRGHTNDQQEMSGRYGQQPQVSQHRRNGDDDEQPSYGRPDMNRNEESNYGRRNDNINRSERQAYGRQNDDDDSERSGYGRRQERSEHASGGYGQQNSFGRNERSDEYNTGRGYGQEAPTYGRNAGNEYGRSQEQSYGSDGFSRASRGNEYSSGGAGGYGSNHRRGEDNEQETMPGGFDGGDDENETRRRAYGRQRNQDEEGEGGYGRRRHGREDDY